MTDQYLICTACGTQHPHTSRSSLPTCFICDDPRQFVPPSGQFFTTLSDLRSSSTSPKYKNDFHPYKYSNPQQKFTSSASRSNSSNTSNGEPKEPTIEELKQAELISITTTPKFGIGQRAILIRGLPSGKNVLWDCVAYLDDDTINTINELGGVDAMVISHPHFYTTHLEWAKTFNCQVWLAAGDRKWRARLDEGLQKEITGEETKILDKNGEETEVVAVKLGGHFPGSLVLHIPHSRRLLTADTIFTTPSGLSNWEVNALGEPRSRPKDTNSYSFMWSIPNMIPLSADEILRMWGILKEYDFTSTHGLMLGQDIEDDNVKKRVLESVRIQLKMMGVKEHPVFSSEEDNI